MAGVEAPGAPGPVPRLDRGLTAAGLALLVALAWLYLWRMAGGIEGAGMAMSATPRFADAGAFALTLAMWAVMMAAMMLPSAAPAILLYGTLVHRHAARGSTLPGMWAFVAAYLLVWTGFSAGATALQTWLEAEFLMAPQMTLASARLGALAIAAAGVYQLTPFKQVCLRHCRHPLQFFVTRWRTGRAASFLMGLEHGAYCLGCCWALMLLLFVAGVMNLAWVAVIAMFVLTEKLLPGGRVISYGAGGGMIVTGLYLVAAL